MPRKKIESTYKTAHPLPPVPNHTLTEDQQRALDLMESGANVFLTGEAGTGKSFVLNRFITRNIDKNIIICAPTGIAAINVGGSTIHRIFKAPLSVIQPGEYNLKPKEALIKADTIIIDEISMCRFDLFEYVIRTIRHAEDLRQAIANDEALAGDSPFELCPPKQLIVVGDFYQLAPVITPKDKEILFKYWDPAIYGGGFAFTSPLWKTLHFRSVILKEIIRQRGDEEFIRNLNRIRIGDPGGIPWFNNNACRSPLKNSIFLCGTNAAADAINRKKSEALTTIPKEYYSKVEGIVEDREKATSDVLSLKVGMQVMTLVNNIKEGYQNGSIGIIVHMTDIDITVRLNNDKLVSVTPYAWEIIDYVVKGNKLEKVVLGSFIQMPLKIAYAITIHKSQGQTYSSVNVSPLCFAEGQLYVALSRAESISGMSLDRNISKQSLLTSRKVTLFYDEIEEEE